MSCNLMLVGCNMSAIQYVIAVPDDSEAWRSLWLLITCFTEWHFTTMGTDRFMRGGPILALSWSKSSCVDFWRRRWANSALYSGSSACQSCWLRMTTAFRECQRLGSVGT